MTAQLVAVVAGCLATSLYVVLRLYRDHSAARERRLFNELIVPNIDDARFDPSEAAGLPGPAWRYLSHSIAPGARVARTVDLRLSGRARRTADAPWRPFSARVRLAAGRGFLCRWRDRSRLGPEVVNIEYLTTDEARSQRFLADLLPVANRAGERTRRAASGQLLLACLWLPSVLLPSRGARWRYVGRDTASVRLDGHGESSTLNLTVDADGAPAVVTLLRYRPGPVGADNLVPFGLRVEGARRFGGYAVPARAVASWGYGTDDAFESLILDLESARYY